MKNITENNSYIFEIVCWQNIIPLNNNPQNCVISGKWLNFNKKNDDFVVSDLII